MAARDVLIRFVLWYFGLYFLPFPLTAFGDLGSFPVPLAWIGQGFQSAVLAYERGANLLAVWVGENLLGFSTGSIVIQPTGSGDTMVQYLRVVVIATLAAIGTVVSTLARSPRLRSPRVDAAFRVYFRYAMAYWLLSYGFAKVPPMQFQPPSADLLVRTYGESSPMGLLWTFMGFSPGYTMFAGLAELVPGLLLLFRRTTTLGALLGAATMTNVAVLNFAYDVPVKLFSLHLLTALIIIAAPDLRRLFNVLVLNRPVPAVTLREQPLTRRWAWAKAAFIALLVGGNILGAYQSWYRFGPGAPRPEVAGVYDVESFALDGEARPPLWTDTTRWRRVLVSHRGFLVVQSMGDRNERFSYKYDEGARTLQLTGFGTKEAFTLVATESDAGLVVEGPFRHGRQVRVELKKQPDRSFPLQTRGFHWVQELPFNR
jgi:uncharacterized membrane protein YphA (DoxX/SURF4 family)